MAIGRRLNVDIKALITIRDILATTLPTTQYIQFNKSFSFLLSSQVALTNGRLKAIRGYWKRFENSIALIRLCAGVVFLSAYVPADVYVCWRVYLCACVLADFSNSKTLALF